MKIKKDLFEVGETRQDHQQRQQQQQQQQQKQQQDLRADLKDSIEGGLPKTLDRSSFLPHFSFSFFLLGGPFVWTFVCVWRGQL